ncbi:MAG: transcriptional regulator [Tomitella sp.]|nr:transcriptional regulator [Tomitella sp.]
MVDTAARVLRLLSLLQIHRQWPAATLADRLQVTARTVRADVTRLRSLGYNIDATSGVGGGYRLRSGTVLPPLLLDDEEALAVAIGLRTAAASGVAGIDEHAARAASNVERLLPSRLRHRLRTLNTVAHTVPNRRASVPAEVLTTVAAACERREQLRLDYLDRHQVTSRRRVEPHQLVHVSGRWYLVAYDLGRDDWRNLRVDRIIPKIPTGPRYTPRALPGPDLATFVTRGRMAALWNYRAQVTVHAPAETVEARIPAGSWNVQHVDAHTSRLDAGAQNADLLAVYLGALDLDFHIDPEQAPELTHAAHRLAQRYLAAVELPATP